MLIYLDDLLLYLAFFMLGFTSGGIYAVQPQINLDQYSSLLLGATGTFAVTFLGIYASIYYSNKQESIKERQKNQIYLQNALVLIASELDHNIDVITSLIDQGLRTMPRVPEYYFDNFELLIESAKPIKSVSFYASFHTPAINEIIENKDLFNDIQIAYYNMDDAVSALSASKLVFLESKKGPLTQEVLNVVENVVNKQEEKLESARILLNQALERCLSELNKFGLNLNKESISPKDILDKNL